MSDPEEKLETKHQGLIDHLAELRVRIVHSLYGLIVATGLAYSQHERLFDFVRHPVQKYLVNNGLVYTGPLDKFMAHIKVSVVFGLIASCPFWLYQIWKFVAPGLYQKERKYMFGFISVGAGLFIAGAAFAYFLVLPMAFEFLFSFAGDTDTPMITIEHYLSFFSQICLMFGVSFELPLIITILGMMGIVSQAFLRRNRRYAVMGIAIVTAVMTPPDLVSMLLMLGPMLALFELGVFFVGFFEKKRLETEF